MPERIELVLINFHHACPAIDNAITLNRFLAIQAVSPRDREIDGFDKHRKAWREANAETLRQKTPYVIEPLFLAFLDAIEESGQKRGLFSRNPPEIVREVIKNASNNAAAQIIEDMVAKSLVHSLHAAPDIDGRARVFREAMVAQSVSSPSSTLCIAASGPNASASVKAGFHTLLFTHNSLDRENLIHECQELPLAGQCHDWTDLRTCLRVFCPISLS